LHLKKHISNLHISNLRSLNNYPADFPIDNSHNFSKSVIELNLPIEKICLLDSEAPKMLSPEDASSFDAFLAGGILGDVDENDPDRTKELRIHGFQTRNLGKAQMTLDTAVLTAYKIICEKTPFEQLQFIDRPTIKIDEKEYIEMPFRYIDVGGEPLLPAGMLDLWKEDLSLN
jgi:ribosome biogenesis SPOUT family RNA methylase Rps3